MDVIGAFLNLIADTNIYIEVLPNWEINKEISKNTLKRVCKLLKALYSLTKPLSAVNHIKFIKQLRLKVIKID